MQYRIIGLSALFLSVMFTTWWVVESSTAFPSYSEKEEGFEEINGPVEANDYSNWVRPPGPPRVGLQAGHFENQDVPDELANLKKSGVGARGGGRNERDVVYAIALEAKTILEQNGVTVDLIPATVPPDYVADAFLSIHADASQLSSVSGFKIASPRIDKSKSADDLAAALYAEYGKATGLPREYTITKRMRGYYAFNWRKYDHAIHPMTPAAIIETGFMTNARDLSILVSPQKLPALGIARGVLAFLIEEGLIERKP